MGKRSGSLSAFRAKQAQQAQAAQAAPTTPSAIDIADAQSQVAVADLPTEELLPTQPTSVEQAAVQPGPAPETLSPATIMEEPAQFGTQEGIMQAAQTPGTVLEGEGLYPQAREARMSENVDLYKQTLEEGAQFRPVSDETADVFGQAVDSALLDSLGEYSAQKYQDTGVTYFQDTLNAGANSFRLSAGNDLVFGVKQEFDLAELAYDPQGAISRAAASGQAGGIFNLAIKGHDKLNMLSNPADPNSDVRPEFGRAAIMATMIELGHRLDGQIQDEGKPASERDFEGALDRPNIGKAIGARIEQLLYPSADANPEAIMRGETSAFGYNSRLSPEEQSILGQTIVQGFADSPLFDWIEPMEIRTEDGRKKISYRTNRDGDFNLGQIRNAIREFTGAKQHDRPVSLVPTHRGRLHGEAAYTQRQVTSRVTGKASDAITPTMQEAIDKLGSVAHTVSPHKVLLAQAMMASAGANPTSANVFARFTKQSDGFARQVVKEKLAELQAEAKKNGQDPNDPNLELIAEQKSAEIVANHVQMRNRTIQDALGRMNKAFYYGYTGINNSSRLMITNTELNYQADKLARFMVDGAKPAVFTKGKGDKAETGFKRVLARSLIHGAEKMSPEDQLTAFEANQNQFLGWGRELLNYTNQNANRLGQEVPPLELSGGKNGLNEFLKDMGKDEFYFAMDALHEYARYHATADGQSFSTRVKAEVDGNSNGAVIQGMQMGIRDIVERGGLIYDETMPDGKDIRQYTFDEMKTTVNETEMDDQRERWSTIVGQIEAKGKVKDLMKIPIMTSIYGKDPQFHQDTAETFIRSNPGIFEKYLSDIEEGQLIDELRDYIEKSLNASLGNALKHSRMAKRIGRAFNLADQIAVIEGANGYEVQAGGYEFEADKSELAQYGPAGGLEDRYITAYKRTPSAAAAAGKVKGAEKAPDIGSKLRNQLAVNGTQNIDATIAQETINEYLGNNPDHFVMQIYDAFMGNADSFADVTDVANEKFWEVNQRYNMLEAERESFRKLKADVKKMVSEAQGNFDIGTEGRYKAMGYFLSNINRIISRDMPEGPARKKAYEVSKGLRSLAQRVGWKMDAPNAQVSPENFLKLFNHAINVLGIEQDLDTLVADTKKKRSELLDRRRSEVVVRQYS